MEVLQFAYTGMVQKTADKQNVDKQNTHLPWENVTWKKLTIRLGKFLDKMLPTFKGIKWSKRLHSKISFDIRKQTYTSLIFWLMVQASCKLLVKFSESGMWSPKFLSTKDLSLS